MRFKAIRLRSLSENPEAFGTTFIAASSWDDNNWISQVRNFDTFIAMLNSKDVGVARLAKDEIDPEAGWIISLWVAPESRGKKIASELMLFVVDWAKALKLKTLKLDVVESNTVAIGLYERLGFTRNGITGNLPAPREHIKEHQLELHL